MKYFVGVTDNSWFEFLANLKPDKVNFWRPSGKLFRAIEVGAPFLFKLHSPENSIVGGGSFVRSFNLPLSLVSPNALPVPRRQGEWVEVLHSDAYPFPNPFRTCWINPPSSRLVKTSLGRAEK